MLPTEQPSSSPVLKVRFPEDITRPARPYGGSTSFNILDYFRGTPDIVTQVRGCQLSFIYLVYDYSFMQTYV